MANDDVQELLTALSAAGVKHLIVGAYALAHHGFVRATAVLGFSDLIAAKRASSKKREPGSVKALQDLADLAWLLEHQKKR